MLSESELCIITSCTAQLHSIMRAHEHYVSRIRQEEIEAQAKLKAERMQGVIEAARNEDFRDDIPDANDSQADGFATE